MNRCTLCRLSIKFTMFLAVCFVPLQSNADETLLSETKDITDLLNDDPYYYTSDQSIADDDGQKESVGVGRPQTTHSKVPHLPVYQGHMSTNYTYRFVNVAEQILTMLGEGKHGLWRVGEAATVREYLKKGKTGLPEDANLFATDTVKIIENNYSHFIPEESWDGYKYPDQKLNENGNLNYIDLPISHPKYKGKYNGHVPIDLASYNCTMSGPEYPYSKKAMEFAFEQPLAGKVGPLGKRAGLDISENYTKILWLDHFPDARTWVNAGVEGKESGHFEYKAVDTSKTKAEYYLVERPFFNVPYLFIIAVYDNEDNDDFSYIRPDGPYWESLTKEQQAEAKTKVTFDQKFHLEEGGSVKAKGLPVYGLHHPNRHAFGGGGYCPSKGGDWGRYPQDNSGSMWPTNYEEVTPLCDGVVLDIKFYSNLDGKNWNDPHKYLANAGAGKKSIIYKMRQGQYGTFTDPYNISIGLKNPDAVKKAPAELTITYPAVNEAVEAK